jgi:hypothetical protein
VDRPDATTEDQTMDSLPLSLAGSFSEMPGAPPAAAATAAASTRAPEPSGQHRGGLRAWLGDMLHFVVWQRDILGAVAELKALDDRMPRNIGLR